MIASCWGRKSVHEGHDGLPLPFIIIIYIYFFFHTWKLYSIAKQPVVVWYNYFCYFYYILYFVSSFCIFSIQTDRTSFDCKKAKTPEVRNSLRVNAQTHPLDPTNSSLSSAFIPALQPVFHGLLQLQCVS